MNGMDDDRPWTSPGWRSRRLRARRQKVTTGKFWPHDARSFAKKFAADHPDVWAVLLAYGDRANLIKAIEQALAGKFRDRGPSELAQAMIDCIPRMKAEMEATDYWRQRLAQELAALERPDPEPITIQGDELTAEKWKGCPMPELAAALERLDADEWWQGKLGPDVE